MATPVITANLANPSTAHNPYVEKGSWVLSTAYAVDDVVSVGSGVFVCITAHTSTATDKPPTGASYTTYWNTLLSLTNTSIEEDLTPGTTETITVADGAHYYREADQSTYAITLGGSPGVGESITALLTLKTKGNTVTFPGSTLAPSVSLSTATNELDYLVVHNSYVGGAAQGWRVVQYDTTTETGTLPATGHTHTYLFEANANDSEGANNLTLTNGASIVGAPPNGALFESINSEYATAGAVLLVDPNSDHTVFFALPNVSTGSGSEDVIFGVGDAVQNDYYVIEQLGNGTLRVHYDRAGGAAISVDIPSGSLPTQDALYMAKREGNTVTLRCITNGVEQTGTYSTALTLDTSVVGARFKAGTYDLHFDDTVYCVVTYNRAVNSSEYASVRAWFQDVRGLTSV